MFNGHLYTNDEIVELESDKFVIDLEKEIVKAKERSIVKYEDIIIYVDQIVKLENDNVIKANRNAVFIRDAQLINSEQIVYNTKTQKAIISKFNGFDTNLKLRFGGENICSTSSKTGYKIAKDSNGKEIKSDSKVIVNTLDARLFTILFDNTYKINRK